MTRRFGRLRGGLPRATSLALALLAATAPSSRAGTPPPPAANARPEGWSDKSYYVAMPDGVRLALSLWFPSSDTGEVRASLGLNGRSGRI